MLDAIEAAQAGNILVFGIRYTEDEDGLLSARNKYGISVMERIARETGGADFDARKTDMKQAFRAIGDELRASYELAYHSKNPASDGTFHKLTVRAKRPDLRVRAKTGYYSRE
jgi:Ca-activated chloride channel family protein